MIIRSKRPQVCVYIYIDIDIDVCRYRHRYLPAALPQTTAPPSACSVHEPDARLWQTSFGAHVPGSNADCSRPKSLNSEWKRQLNFAVSWGTAQRWVLCSPEDRDDHCCRVSSALICLRITLCFQVLLKKGLNAWIDTLALGTVWNCGASVFKGSGVHVNVAGYSFPLQSVQNSCWEGLTQDFAV